jgi:hypothetical protein
VLTLSPLGGKISVVTAFVLLDEHTGPAAVFECFGRQSLTGRGYRALRPR